MRVTDRLTLPTDAVLKPADSLDPRTKVRLGHNQGDYVLTRPGSRNRTILIDAEAARFLLGFQRPCTLAEGLIDVCRTSGAEPDTVLAEILPLVSHLVNRGLLVVADSPDAREIRPTLTKAQSFHGYLVIECVHIFQDVEVYHVVNAAGRSAALKILRQTSMVERGTPSRRRLAQEVSILNYLDGLHVPNVLAYDAEAQPGFLVTSWCAGRDLSTHAQVVRGGMSSTSQNAAAALCISVLQAYADLHEASILHGDVHPGNIIIGPAGEVNLLDFGFGSSSLPGPMLPSFGRGGLAQYVEPEYCRALALGAASPPVTQASEQFALAALCFQLLTGAHHVRFGLQHEVWLSQVLTEPPRSFASCGTPAWPKVEKVLGRALSKQSRERFPTTREFARQLGQAAKSTGNRHGNPAELGRFVDQMMRRLTPNRRGLPTHIVRESGSAVHSGAAGVAYFFYHLACLNDAPALLATADLWSSYARAHMTTSGASLFHGQAGVNTVDALIRLAAGDRAAVDAATLESASDGPSESPEDLLTGRAGLLLGYAAILDAQAAGLDWTPVGTVGLAATGDRIAVGVGVTSPGGQVEGHGLGHGRAGLAYAALRWFESSGHEPIWLQEELDILSGAVRPGDGRRSRRSVNDPLGGLGAAAAHNSWCRGLAGQVLLWNLAARCFPGNSFDALADASAERLWRDRDAAGVGGSLCCGYAGQVYAMLAQLRRTGQSRWLARAEGLGERAVNAAPRVRSQVGLFSGQLGIALMTADIGQHDFAAFPLVEGESWRPG